MVMMIVDSEASSSDQHSDSLTTDTANLDQIIEVSLLKLRRMQIMGVKEERHRLLVLETLHRTIEKKMNEQERLAGTSSSKNDRINTFLTILQEAVSRLGLCRILRFSITIPEIKESTNDSESMADSQSNDTLPRVRLPGGGSRNKNNRGELITDLLASH
jgi:hypothetical protein